MKIHTKELLYSYYDRMLGEYVTEKIIATNLFQLMRTFVTNVPQMQRKECWQQFSENICDNVIEFPIVRTTVNKKKTKLK